MTGTGLYTPEIYGNAAGSFTIQYYSSNTFISTFTYSASPPAFVVDTWQGAAPTGSCSTYMTANLVGKNGHLACSMTIVVQSTRNIVGVQVLFPTGAGQWTEILNYCDVYFSAGTSTVTKGQLLCSRIDTSGTAAGFFISGFGFSSPSTLTLAFRMIASTATTVSVTVNEQISNAGTYYTVATNAIALTITGGFSTACMYN